MKIYLLVIFYLFQSINLFGQNIDGSMLMMGHREEVSIFDRDFDSFPRLKSKMDLSEQARTILGFTLRADLSLAEIPKKLGKCDFFQTGDAAGFETKIVYLNNNPKGREAVSFVSGEMGGGKYVTHIRIFDPNKCKLIIQPSANLKMTTPYSFKNGIRLGLTKEEVKKILGEPQKSGKDAWAYYFEHEQKWPKKDKAYFLYKKENHGMEPIYSQSSSIQLKFENEKVVLVQVSRLEGTF